MIPPQYFRFSGGVMVPRHSRLAEQSYTSGVTYRLGIVAEREEGRSAEQNNLMWELLTEISKQVVRNGAKFTPDEWKCIFMAAIGKQTVWLPSLDGKTVIPYYHSSSRLTRKEFTELLDFITDWGDKNGVLWAHDQGMVWE